MVEKNLINLLGYSICNADKEAILDLIPDNLSKIEIASLLIGVYSKAIDQTVFEIKKGVEKKK